MRMNRLRIQRATIATAILLASVGGATAHDVWLTFTGDGPNSTKAKYTAISLSFRPKFLSIIRMSIERL